MVVNESNIECYQICQKYKQKESYPIGKKSVSFETEDFDVVADLVSKCMMELQGENANTLHNISS